MFRGDHDHYWSIFLIITERFFLAAFALIALMIGCVQVKGPYYLETGQYQEGIANLEQAQRCFRVGTCVELAGIIHAFFVLVKPVVVRGATA